ncbi:MAG: hypothetical protein M3O71_15470 [Bacteroidota bacterium]|nr:hypothetical protein [Bacteroidota bacterium]
MNKSKTILKKKTTKKYAFRETYTGCTDTSDPDTTSPTTLTTTHLLKR